MKYAESETKRALRKAHALPKHIANTAAFYPNPNTSLHVINPNPNLNSNSNSNFHVGIPPNSKFPPSPYNTPAPYESYMVPYEGQPEVYVRESKEEEQRGEGGEGRGVKRGERERERVE